MFSGRRLTDRAGLADTWISGLLTLDSVNKTHSLNGQAQQPGTDGLAAFYDKCRRSTQGAMASLHG